jgi:hypothetical protein
MYLIREIEREREIAAATEGDMLQGHMAVGTELNNYVEITKYSR